MENSLVSIIVPVYNCKSYLSRCVDSLVAQTYSNIEIILVDDGSDDGSSELCDKYKDKSNIKVIHQKNLGVSAARNNGVDSSKGEYITFVDADDWIAIDLVEKLVQALDENKDADVAICGYYVVTEKNIVAKRAIPKQCTTIKSILSQNIPAYSWGKLYSSSKLKEYLKFPEGISMGEDTAMLLPLYSHIDNFVYLDESLYYYFQREESATHSLKDAKKMYSYLEGGYLAIVNSDSKYTENVAYAIADRIVSNEVWFLKFCLADAIEYVVQNMMPYFENNKAIKDSNKVKRILQYPNMQLIPNVLVYDNFGISELNEIESVCKASWKKYVPKAQLIELNEDNCDISRAPKGIQEAYSSQDYETVGHYFKLKYIHEHGGVGVCKNLCLTTSLGSVRAEETFFALKDRYEFQDRIYGGVAGSTAIEFLFETYGENSIYKDQTISLGQRIRELLLERYNYNSAGWTVKLNDNEVTVFKCDVLTWQMNDNNIAKILDEVQLNLPSNLILVDKSVLRYWEEDKTLFWKDREQLKKTVAAQNSSITELNNTCAHMKKQLDEIKKMTQDAVNNGYDTKKMIDLISYINKMQIASIKKILPKTAEADVTINQLRAEIESLKHSRSWRITAPLRCIGKIFRRLRGVKQ